MVEVILDGYKYQYHKTEQGGHWTGVAGYKGSFGRYPNCAVPTMMWGPLRKKAMADGYTVSDFSAPKEKSKSNRSKPSKAKKPKNSISIF